MAYAAKDPKITAISVLPTAVVRLLIKYFAASILEKSCEKLSVENTLGRKDGGTATTSDPGLNEQQIT